MSSTVQSGADTLNVKKNVADNPVKRTVAKLRHPMRAGVSPAAAEKSLDTDVDQGDEVHATTGEYATSATHAVSKAVGEYLEGAEGQAVLRKVFGCLAGAVGADLLQTDEFQATSRMAGRELVLGVSEGLELKLSTPFEKLPRGITVSVLPIIAVFLGLFLLGLLLALWRFALFGLHD